MVAKLVRRLVLSLGVGLIAATASLSIAGAQDQPANPNADAAKEAEIAATKRAVSAAVEDFKVAYATGSAEKLWGVLAPTSQAQLTGDLAAIKETLSRLPAQRRTETIDALNSTAAEILKLENGQAYLGWLITRVAQGEKEAVRLVKLESVELSADGKEATLAWTAPTDAGKAMLTNLPKKAVLGDDRKWRIVLASN